VCNLQDFGIHICLSFFPFLSLLSSDCLSLHVCVVKIPSKVIRLNIRPPRKKKKERISDTLRVVPEGCYGVDTISRLLKIIRLFCKSAL